MRHWYCPAEIEASTAETHDLFNWHNNTSVVIMNWDLGLVRFSPEFQNGQKSEHKLAVALNPDLSGLDAHKLAACAPEIVNRILIHPGSPDLT